MIGIPQNRVRGAGGPRTIGRFAVAVLLGSLLPTPAAAQEAEGPALTLYPSYHLKFAQGGRNYLLASLVLVNVSGQELRGLTLTQSFPDSLVAAPAPDGIHEHMARPEGFEESVEGSSYTLRLPLLRRRELIAGYVVLSYHGRPSQAEVPPAEIEYSLAGQPRRQQGPPLTLGLTKYSKYSGSLADFIKRYAGLQIRLPASSSADWGFSALASRIRAKTPINLVEIEGDAAEGRFSLLSGAPGESREVLVAWRPRAKVKPVATAEDARRLVGDQVAAAADFALDLEGASVEKRPFARGEAWVVAGRWKDRVAGRLGEGPIQWYVYDDPQKEARYLVMIRGQGRGAGAGKAETPNPEKEAALMAELEEIARSLRPI